MDIAFEGLTVLITGPARGIGRAIVQGFAARGARIHALDILADGLAACARETQLNRGATLATHRIDLADGVAVKSLIGEIEAAAPQRGIDVVVHAAGGVRGQSKKAIEDVTDADWRAIMDANVTSAFNLARAVAPAMKARQRGRIVMISSQAGLGVSLTGIAAYGTAKAAEIGFVRQLAHELGAYNVTVNSVAPGFMPTSPDYVRQWEAYPPERQRAIIDAISLKRIGTPEDIANAVMFLASDYAGYITGQTLQVRGAP